MFVKAYEIVSNFTHPVIISTRHFDGTVECGCGAFIILNEEGWIISVAHIWQAYLAWQVHSKEIPEYNRQLKLIEEDPKWITNVSFWFGWDGIVLKDVKVFDEADLCIGRLDPFSANLVKSYPILKKTGVGAWGKSLCKLGFPFHEIKATFDEQNNTFKFAEGALPLPRFPLEGIYTRDLLAGKSKDGKYDLKFLETSSPGLRGQSGGPIFDEKGIIWAIQSRTQHLPLGFSPKIKKDGVEIEEHQFLNVGSGAHHELIVKFLQDNNIKFNESDY